MKLYTEFEIRSLLNDLMMLECSVDEAIESLTPIELPSDEEEEKNAISLTQNIQQHIGFNIGAKWMKEQILNQNK